MIFHVNPLLCLAEDSCRQRIHMKYQALFSSTDKSKIKVSSAAILLGYFMVN